MRINSFRCKPNGADIAQSVEHSAVNRKVTGSTPVISVK